MITELVTRIAILIGSHHLVEGDFQEINPGIFVSFNKVTAGVYRNSFDDTSFALTYDFPINKHIEVFAGGAYYPDAADHFKSFAHLGNLVPMAGIRVTYKNVFVQIMPDVVAAGLTWRIQ